MAIDHLNVVANPKPGTAGYLKFYWTKSAEGRAKWTTSPHPFEALRLHLAKFLDPAILDKVVAQWFHDALGFWPSTPHVGAIPTPGLKKGKN